MNATENTATKTTYRCEEPTHEEIALAAFLAWEKEGRQPGREMDYWLQAETQIRAARQKRAEAAAQAALPWPRPTRAAQVRKPAAKAAENLATAVKRSTTPKASARPSARQ